MRTVIMYGSLREGSSSKRVAQEMYDHLKRFGSEVVMYNPKGLPLFDSESYDHPKCVELFDLGLWADSYVWVSPEYHGGPSGVIKNQIDWLPCRDRAVRVTEGKPVAVMSVTGGAQSFNTINQLVLNARWLKMPVVATHYNWSHSHQDRALEDHQRIEKSAQELFKMTL